MKDRKKKDKLFRFHRNIRPGKKLPCGNKCNLMLGNDKMMSFFGQFTI